MLRTCYHCNRIYKVPETKARYACGICRQVLMTTDPSQIALEQYKAKQLSYELKNSVILTRFLENTPGPDSWR